MALDLLERKSLMTIHEVAQYLQLSVSTVKKKTASGNIPSVKLGRSVRYRPEAIFCYISDHTRQLHEVRHV
jgi:excisionase family DNA binding protein